MNEWDLRPGQVWALNDHSHWELLEYVDTFFYEYSQCDDIVWRAKVIRPSVRFGPGEVHPCHFSDPDMWTRIPAFSLVKTPEQVYAKLRRIDP